MKDIAEKPRDPTDNKRQKDLLSYPRGNLDEIDQMTQFTKTQRAHKHQTLRTELNQILHEQYSLPSMFGSCTHVHVCCACMYTGVAS